MMPARDSGLMSAGEIRSWPRDRDHPENRMTPENQGSIVEHAEIETKLKGLLGKQSEVSVDVETIGAETKIEDIGFDSVSILDFMYEIESELDVELEVRDLVTMETVGDLIGHLATKLGE